MDSQVIDSLCAAPEDMDRRIEEAKAQLQALRAERRRYAKPLKTLTNGEGRKEERDEQEL